MNMDSMHREIKRLQTQFRCKICKERYSRDWCPADEATCMFCTRYHLQMTRMIILRDMDWCYIRSGSEDRIAYYREFTNYLNIWCNRYSIPMTGEDYQYIQEKLEGL